MLEELLDKPYSEERYETARKAAAKWILGLSGGDPRAWTPEEFAKLRKFFHSDLAEKLFLSGGS